MTKLELMEFMSDVLTYNFKQASDEGERVGALANAKAISSELLALMSDEVSNEAKQAIASNYDEVISDLR